MQDFWLRIILAATLSVSGVLGTYLWSRTNHVSVTSSGPKVLARLVSSTNEVQRRPENRLIWQPTFLNQELHAGEAVRTASDAEARIEFLSKNGTGTTIELDRDSVIEIHETQSGINLDFLKGSMYIRSTGDDQAITVQSGDQKIELAKSEVQLTKANTKSAVDIEVFKGKADFSKNGQPVHNAEKKLKLLSPAPNKPVYIRNEEGQNRVVFQWIPIEADYDVTLETGPSRSKLKPMQDVAPVSGSQGRLEATLPVGRTYFRLVAQPKRPGLSVVKGSISRADIKALLPPLLLEPAANSPIVPKSQEGMVSFRWSNPGALNDLIIEVSDSADLKEVFYKKQMGRELATEFSLIKPGERFWRVSGRVPGSSQMVSSVVQRFYIQSKDAEPLAAPQKLTMLPAQTLSLYEMKTTGIKLGWQAVKGASSYKVTIESSEIDPATQKPKSFTQETAANNLNVKNLSTGKYKWSVVAASSAGLVSPVSETKDFAVDGVPVLTWADGHKDVRTVYKTAQPVLSVAWQKGPPSAVQWRFRFGNSRVPASDAPWAVLTAPKISLPLQEAGKYQIEVEALDANENVVARTETRTQEFVQAPPLPGPKFGSSVPSEINARNNGTASISWTPVSEAQGYVVQVKSLDGKTVVNTVKSRRPAAEIPRLKAGQYKVSLQTVDAAGRTGPEGDSRTLKVPEYSNVKAPKLKGVKVK